MHPFNPQPVDQLRARFPAAIRTVYDWSSGVRHSIGSQFAGLVNPVSYKGGPPSENVFDFSDGLRLVITMDKKGQEVFLHVSARAQLNTEAMRQFSLTGREGQARFKHMVEQRYKEISGDRLSFVFDGLVDSTGAAHWRRRLSSL